MLIADCSLLATRELFGPRLSSDGAKQVRITLAKSKAKRKLEERIVMFEIRVVLF